MRPIIGLKRKCLTIPEDTYKWLKEIGKGNASKGIRKLHRMHQKIDYPFGRPRKNPLT